MIDEVILGMLMFKFKFYVLGFIVMFFGLGGLWVVFVLFFVVVLVYG